MKSHSRMWWILVGICLIFSLPARGEGGPVILKLATLAPEGSAWMKAFHNANKELESRTDGVVKMHAYPGGIMGDDHAILRKMRIDQIHIAGITGLGLGAVCKDVQVMGTPFLFQTYDEVDYVLQRVQGRLEGVLEKNGFVLLGWPEIGFIYLMSNRPVASLDAFRGAKVWMPEGDPVSQAVFQKIGVSPVPLAISDVLLALQTGLVDVVYSPPVGAITLQWFTKVKYITRVPLSYAIGGLLITQKAFDRIPIDHQQTFKGIFHEKLSALNVKTRADNEEALRVMEREGIQTVEPSPQELARFQEIAREATEEMAGRVFSREILKDISTHLDTLRGGK